VTRLRRTDEKTEILLLRFFATRLKGMTWPLLSNALIAARQRCPIEGTSDLGEFLRVTIRSPQFFHAIVYRICMSGVGRIIEDLGKAPVANLILFEECLNIRIS
jgi:hypothetical protein